MPETARRSIPRQSCRGARAWAGSAPRSGSRCVLALVLCDDGDCRESSRSFFLSNYCATCYSLCTQAIHCLVKCASFCCRLLSATCSPDIVKLYLVFSWSSKLGGFFLSRNGVGDTSGAGCASP